MSSKRPVMERVAQAVVSTLAAVILFVPGQTTLGQETSGTAPAESSPPSPTPEGGAATQWSMSAAVYTYIVPDTPVYAQPTLAADYSRLHLEARYNYEDLDTGSAWLGGNFSVGSELWLEFTPMVGGVFGHTTGVAPGYELSLGYWKLGLYSEGEYLFDTQDHTGNFAYAWSELTLTPVEWLQLGMVAQRTRAYETDVDIQRGLLAGLSYRWMSLTTYVFNLDQKVQTVVLAVGADF